MSDFNQKEYIKDWKKENYKQFKVELKKEEKENLDRELKKHNLSGSDFVRIAFDYLKRGKLKKDEKDH